MPTTVASLRAAADQAERDAIDAAFVAADLERHHQRLQNRLQPVLDRHTDDVWQSRAAALSRMRLWVYATGTLNQARSSLLDVANDVRRRIDELELIASEYRRQANRIEAMAAAAAAAEAEAAAQVSTPPPPETSAPGGSSSHPPSTAWMGVR